MSRPPQLVKLLADAEDALAEGRLEDAESLCRAAILAGEQLAEAHFLLGEALREIGRAHV